MGLKDEDAIVPVGDKPGKIIALGMDKPEDIRILGGKETKTNAVAKRSPSCGSPTMRLTAPENIHG